MLLAAGAMGGLGNPHFVTKSIPRPKYATKGDGGMRIQLQLELKLLADVGLVGRLGCSSSLEDEPLGVSSSIGILDPWLVIDDGTYLSFVSCSR